MTRWCSSQPWRRSRGSGQSGDRVFRLELTFSPPHATWPSPVLPIRLRLSLADGEASKHGDHDVIPTPPTLMPEAPMGDARGCPRLQAIYARRVPHTLTTHQHRTEHGGMRE